MLEWRRFEAPGNVNCLIVASDAGIRAIEFHGQPQVSCREGVSNPLLRRAVDQLCAYFAGELREFDLSLDMQGTVFQIRVWRELLKIPYGKTCSYGFVATAIGAPAAMRGCRRRGERTQSDSNCGAVPSRDRRGRLAGGLRRRAAAEALPFGS